MYNINQYIFLYIIIFVNYSTCRDFYLGMFKKNDLLMSQDTLYKEKIPYKFTQAKYGRIYKCPITYVRVVDRLHIGRGPRIEIIRGGLQKKYIVLRLTSPYNNPISVNIYVGCENKKFTNPPWKIIRRTTTTKDSASTASVGAEEVKPLPKNTSEIPSVESPEVKPLPKNTSDIAIPSVESPEVKTLPKNTSDIAIPSVESTNDTIITPPNEPNDKNLDSVTDTNSTNTTEKNETISDPAMRLRLHVPETEIITKSLTTKVTEASTNEVSETVTKDVYISKNIKVTTALTNVVSEAITEDVSTALINVETSEINSSKAANTNNKSVKNKKNRDSSHYNTT